jgi:hypothetical protein
MYRDYEIRKDKGSPSESLVHERLLKEANKPKEPTHPTEHPHPKHPNKHHPGASPDNQQTPAKPNHPADTANLVKHGSLPHVEIEGGNKFQNALVKITRLFGGNTDTDGIAAKDHPEDEHRRSATSLKQGGQFLNTDKDKFVALPSAFMQAHNLKIGDRGILRRLDTNETVPVVIGDTNKKQSFHRVEASIAAFDALHFKHITGNNGVDDTVPFELDMNPSSGGEKRIADL